MEWCGDVVDGVRRKCRSWVSGEGDAGLVLLQPGMAVSSRSELRN